MSNMTKEERRRIRQLEYEIQQEKLKAKQHDRVFEIRMQIIEAADETGYNCNDKTTEFLSNLLARLIP